MSDWAEYYHLPGRGPLVARQPAGFVTKVYVRPDQPREARLGAAPPFGRVSNSSSGTPASNAFSNS